MSWIDKYLVYLTTVRRYSPRTQALYREALASFRDFAGGEEDLLESLTAPLLRAYEVYLLDKRKMDARTVNQQLSVLSGFCRFLTKEGALASNPVRTVKRPKMEKRLPDFYRNDALSGYFARTEADASEETLPLVMGRDKVSQAAYSRRLSRLIISLLYGTGIRRAELCSLTVGSVDGGRRVLRVDHAGLNALRIALNRHERRLELMRGVLEECRLSGSLLLDPLSDPDPDHTHQDADKGQCGQCGGTEIAGDRQDRIDIDIDDRDVESVLLPVLQLAVIK